MDNMVRPRIENLCPSHKDVHTKKKYLNLCDNFWISKDSN